MPEPINCTLYGKGNPVDVKDLRWGDYLKDLWQAHCRHKGHHRTVDEATVRVTERYDRRWSDAATGQDMSASRARRVKGLEFFLNLQEEHRPAVRDFWASRTLRL